MTQDPKKLEKDTAQELCTKILGHENCFCSDCCRVRKAITQALRSYCQPALEALKANVEESLYFVDDSNGPGDWYCHSCHASEKSDWNKGNAVYPKVFNHNKDCGQQLAKSTLEGYSQ